MTRTLQTFMESIPAATASDVLRGLDETVAPNAEYRCMNPTCEQMCAWPSGYAAGRPTRFCSRRCRQIFDRIKARLSTILGKEVVVQGSTGLSWRGPLDLELGATAFASRGWHQATEVAGEEPDRAVT